MTQTEREAEKKRLVELLEEEYGETVVFEKMRDCWPYDKIQKMCVSSNEVADYLLSNGVIVPPCKVGDTVYVLDCIKTYPREAEVLGLEFYSDNRSRIDIMYKEYPYCQDWFDGRFVNKTIFLTREEAEQALKEREKHEV